MWHKEALGLLRGVGALGAIRGCQGCSGCQGCIGGLAGSVSTQGSDGYRLHKGAFGAPRGIGASRDH